jgi:hypothetical protein
MSRTCKELHYLCGGRVAGNLDCDEGLDLILLETHGSFQEGEMI